MTVTLVLNKETPIRGREKNKTNGDCCPTKEKNRSSINLMERRALMLMSPQTHTQHM